jgi:heme-degrading monooxygenase HmoA
MIARVTTIQGEPGRAEAPDFSAFIQGAVPIVQQQPGFKGLYLLADRNTGEGLAITLWETEQQAAAMGEGRLLQLRDEALQKVGAAAGPTSKHYEVIVQA